MFVVSLSSYDQMMVEEPDTNRMNDALTVFELIVNEPLLAHQEVIVFLNKADLFKKKVKISSINAYFPDFKGTIDSLETKKGSVTQGIEYFREKFISRERNKQPRSINCHVTCCTDTQIMSKIISHVT
jgi:hypothetical protein